MQTKLTFRLDDRLIEQAKHYAQRQGKSLSQLVADYFARLSGPESASQPDLPEEQLPPLTRALWGSLEGVQVDERDYQQHLEDKYLCESSSIPTLSLMFC
ncbi:MAG: DUF6364 family protein [Caldilineaceae bacterium]